MFIDPGKALSKFRYIDATYVWLRGLLYRYGENSLYVDCVFHNYAPDPVIARAVLVVKLPPKVGLKPYPEYSAKMFESECKKLCGNDIEYIYKFAKELKGFHTVNPLQLALSHILSPHKWILGDIDRVGKSTAYRIASSILIDVANQLKEFVAYAEPNEVYILFAKKGEEIYMFYGDSPVRNKVVEKMIREYGDKQKVFNA